MVALDHIHGGAGPFCKKKLKTKMGFVTKFRWDFGTNSFQLSQACCHWCLVEARRFQGNRCLE